MTPTPEPDYDHKTDLLLAEFLLQIDLGDLKKIVKKALKSCFLAGQEAGLLEASKIVIDHCGEVITPEDMPHPDEISKAIESRLNQLKDCKHDWELNRGMNFTEKRCRKCHKFEPMNQLKEEK